MRAYYNEHDPYCAQWLRNQIEKGLIAHGDVDDRDIRDVRPEDLRGYHQAHFFAGVGGWSHALRLAQWQDDRPVWTGSCPCQPVSVIGKRQGHADERHLWPAFHRLISECRPAIVFGEQVANKDGVEWLGAVRADLEAARYAVGAADLPAVCVGAPHIRQRLWFVAYTDQAGWPNVEGIAATPSQADVGRPASLAHCETAWDIRGAPEPDPSWIVDGLSGEGAAVGAFGNAIVPQLGAEFIRASIGAISDIT